MSQIGNSEALRQLAEWLNIRDQRRAPLELDTDRVSVVVDLFRLAAASGGGIAPTWEMYGTGGTTDISASTDGVLFTTPPPVPEHISRLLAVSMKITIPSGGAGGDFSWHSAFDTGEYKVRVHDYPTFTSWNAAAGATRDARFAMGGYKPSGSVGTFTLTHWDGLQVVPYSLGFFFESSAAMPAGSLVDYRYLMIHGDPTLGIPPV